MEDATGAATVTSTSEAGPRTDRLELLQQLGGATIGTVHKARNPKLNRTVALRQLQVPEWLDDAEDLIKRILAEARAASALDHPNITRLYTGGYKKFTVFLTSEFVEGTNIKEYVSSRNLGLTEIIGLAKQLCAALDFAHQKKVNHYALNPANVKVLADGTVKVMDFGLLRDKELYAPTPAKRLESEHYLSPEQLKNKPVSPATNLFSAATIIYELLTTRNPFAGKHLGEVDRNISDVEPNAASNAHNRVPEAVSKAVMRALAKNPLARFQSCAEFSTALEEALQAASSKMAASPGSTAAAANPATKTGSWAAQNVPLKPAVTAPEKAVATNGPAQATPPKPTPAPAPVSGNNNGSKTTPSTKPALTIVRSQPAPVVPNKMPAKMLTQWKLVGAAVAALFVVSAVAISFNHRSKVPVATREPDQPSTAQSSQQPEVVVPETTAEPPIDVREVTSRPTRQRNTRAAVAPAAPATDGQLTVSSEPDGAVITVEGKTTESWRTPQTIASLAPAVYRVTVSKSGYATETRNVQVVSGNRAALDVKLTPLKAWLNINVTPSGTRILIDGKETGKFSPAEFTLDPATHNITLKKEGYFDSSNDIKLTAGQRLSYSPSLTPAGRTDNIKVVGGGFKKLFGGGSSEGMSRMEIRTEPKGAQVTVNGTVVPKITPFEIQLEPGNYQITLEKDGYQPVHKSITTQANQKLKIEEQLSK